MQSMDLIKASIQRHTMVAESVMTTMYFLNSELVRQSSLLRESQPKRVGALTLQLYECGKKCNGCPHPKWKKWVANRPVIRRHGDNFPTDISQQRARWKAIPVASPRRVLRSKEYSEETREIVERMLNLIEQRGQLLDAMQRMLRLTNLLEDKHPVLSHPQYLKSVTQIRQAAVKMVEEV